MHCCNTPSDILLCRAQVKNCYRAQLETTQFHHHPDHSAIKLSSSGSCCAKPLLPPRITVLRCKGAAMHFVQVVFFGWNIILRTYPCTAYNVRNTSCVDDSIWILIKTVLILKEPAINFVPVNMFGQTAISTTYPCNMSHARCFKTALVL